MKAVRRILALPLLALAVVLLMVSIGVGWLWQLTYGVENLKQDQEKRPENR